MPIADWPSAERPRERLLAQGPEALSDAELLAIFLRTGRPGASAVELARELLSHFGGLRELLNCECRQFIAIPGLGPAKYCQLRAVLELARRHLRSEWHRDTALANPALTRCYLTLWLRDRGEPHTDKAAMCKWLAPKVAVDIIHDCLLTHGHAGYSTDSPHQQRLRDVIGLEIGDGTAQISKLIIARERIGNAAVQYR